MWIHRAPSSPAHPQSATWVLQHTACWRTGCHQCCGLMRKKKGGKQMARLNLKRQQLDLFAHLLFLLMNWVYHSWSLARYSCTFLCLQILRWWRPVLQCHPCMHLQQVSTTDCYRVSYVIHTSLCNTMTSCKISMSVDLWWVPQTSCSDRNRTCWMW